MVRVNNVNHYNLAEITMAIEELMSHSGRGAYRPEEVPGLAAEALDKSPELIEARRRTSVTGIAIMGNRS